VHKHSIITFVLAILYHMNKVGVDECDTASYADHFPYYFSEYFFTGSVLIVTIFCC